MPQSGTYQSVAPSSPATPSAPAWWTNVIWSFRPCWWAGAHGRCRTASARSSSSSTNAVSATVWSTSTTASGDEGNVGDREVEGAAEGGPARGGHNGQD